ncbi:MAG: sugar transferase [Pseudomonadota bacterium]|nr:sugar transferase [Pseudomonadota bacterium]
MRDALKRGMDCAGALGALLVLSPVMLIVAALVLADLGRPVLFRQVRTGRWGVPFTMTKFRTMREAHDPSGAPLPDELRVTAVGRLLRRFRLDETPELLMVLTGRMSLVGPRPLPPEILGTIPRSAERLGVRPGLTGLAQVSGNTLLTNHEKVAIDIHYSRTWSLGLDLRILLKTVVMLAIGSRRDEVLIREALAAFAAPAPVTAGAVPAGPGAQPR